MHSSAILSILVVFALSHTDFVAFAHPVHANSDLTERVNHVLIGYRYVPPEVAAEYNAKGTLTSIIASQEQTGPGAYISPGLGEWQTSASYWQCRILADHDKFAAAPKFFMPDTTMRTGSVLTNYLATVHQDPTKTLLFSKINGDSAHRQLLIPTYYLPRSSVPKKAAPNWGSGDLGITAQCIAQDATLNAASPVADWESDWKIPGWQI
ncbi:hypothetical protein C8R44DRAFT_744487 [Mycena epipterygia]|nr:hypothetical protein C8R44DRAFT_744487 [Mycena epipterygia]